MATTPNGGETSKIQNTEIHQIYDWLVQQRQCGWLTFRRSVLGYTAGGSTDQVVYEARSFQYSVGGVAQTFLLPKMTYVGYTPAEVQWIDQFYGALVRRLQSGDATFMSSPAMQELANSAASSRDVFSLRAPNGIEGAGIPGGHKGVGVKVDWDGDNQQETVVITEDLHNQKKDKLINEPRLKAEFVSRVFHEMLHRNWSHNIYAYDPDRSIIENLQDDFTLSDMRALDRVYGEAKNVLVDLAANDQALGLQTGQLNSVWRDGTDAALKSAQNYRIKELYTRTEKAITNGVADFTAADLKLLDKEGLIKMRPYP
ncbi:MAG: hypothetical protein ABW171_10830, partial [Steroidobacter sp.]